MRKIYTLVCLILLGFSVNTLAQNSVTLPDFNATHGPVTIPVEYNFTVDDVCAFEIEITFDNELEYGGFSPGSIPGLTTFEVNETSPCNGIIRIEGATLTPISNTGTIVFLEFNYTGTGGSTNFEFTLNTTNHPGTMAPSGAPSILINCDIAPGLVVDATFTNGSITYVSPVPLSSWAVLLGIVLIAAFAVIRIYRIV